MMVEGKSPLHTATNYGTQGSDACPDLPKSPSGGRATPTAILVYLCAIGEGYDIGVFATVLVRLQEAFQISSKTLGILAAVLYIGAIVGACTAGPLADWVGRKKGLSVACIFLTLGTSMMALASGITSLIVGRIIMGIGVGLGVPLGGLYIVRFLRSTCVGPLAQHLVHGLCWVSPWEAWQAQCCKTHGKIGE